MRILIVEDEPALGTLLKSNLEAEAYAVDLESDGERAFRSASVNEYDAIVLDDILPGKRGSEICEELRRKGRTTPFSYREMSARLRALLRRPRNLQPQTLQVADLVLDTASGSASRGGKHIHLTTKEFALLHYLMQHEGQLVTRAMIFEHVWNDAIDLFSNMIETHIYNLRKKIDKPGLTKLIHTLSGRGYILGKR